MANNFDNIMNYELKEVKFWQGTNLEYENLKLEGNVKDDTIYFVLSNNIDIGNSIYLGEELMNDYYAPGSGGSIDEERFNELKTEITGIAEQVVGLESRVETIEGNQETDLESIFNDFLLGNMSTIVDAVVDEINKNGGIGGGSVDMTEVENFVKLYIDTNISPTLKEIQDNIISTDENFNNYVSTTNEKFNNYVLSSVYESLKTVVESNTFCISKIQTELDSLNNNLDDIIKNVIMTTIGDEIERIVGDIAPNIVEQIVGETLDNKIDSALAWNEGEIYSSMMI